MAFPAGPTNNQTTTVNGTVYIYNTADNAWSRLSSPPGNLTVLSNLTSSGNLIASNIYFGNIAWANGRPISFTGTYSNVNVAAYIPNDETITTLRANIGAYYNYANANVAAIQANLGSYQIYANSSLSTIQANNGAFQTYANANIGAFYNYANTKIGNNNNSNLVVIATTTSTSTTTGALVVRGGVGVAGNIISGGNVTGLYGTFVSNLSVGEGSIQQDALNLNNNNLYNVNNIRFNDPGTSEGLSWEGGSGWSIYESPNDLSNNTGNLQIVLSGSRVFTIDTNQTINVPSSRVATSTTTGALTVAGGVGIVGALHIGGTGDVSANIGRLFTSNVVTQANLGAYQTWANANFGSSTYGNLAVAAFLPTHTGNISAGNISVTNKIFTTEGLYWAGNGVAFSSGGGGGGGASALDDLTDVIIDTPTLALGQVLKYNGSVWVNDTDLNSGGGGSGTFAYTAAAMPPITANTGDQWFQTTSNILYYYVGDGVSTYWVDVSSPVYTANEALVTTTLTTGRTVAMSIVFGG
jgi:hypothetical protein